MRITNVNVQVDPLVLCFFRALFAKAQLHSWVQYPGESPETVAMLVSGSPAAWQVIAPRVHEVLKQQARNPLSQTPNPD